MQKRAFLVLKMDVEGPRHIAIILDGNRRYAKNKGMSPWQGHRFGVKKVEELLKWCSELGVKELTLYSFSMDNFKRPEKERKAIFELFKENIHRLEDDENLKKYDVKVNFAGRLDKFPAGIRKDMQRIMEKTKGNRGFVLNFAMAYSGRSEIADSVKKIISRIRDKEISKEDVDEKMISDNLYITSNPDILIRTGGEKRISDFLIWQNAYTELFFVDKLWPEFENEDLEKVVGEYKQRERRYGR